MGLLQDIGLAAAEGALRGALHPFVQQGKVTSAQADTIAKGAIDLFKAFENAAKSPPHGDVIEAAIRGALNPLVAAGDLDATTADEIAQAGIDAVHLVMSVVTPSAQPPSKP